MPAYDWTCRSCDASVAAAHESCPECGCPSVVSAADLAYRGGTGRAPQPEPEEGTTAKALLEFLDRLGPKTVGCLVAAELLALFCFMFELPDYLPQPDFFWLFVYTTLAIPQVGLFVIAVVGNWTVLERLHILGIAVLALAFLWWSWA